MTPYSPLYARFLATIGRLPQDGSEAGPADGTPTPDGDTNPVTPPGPRRPRHTWLIDCGHGLLTEGKRSPFLTYRTRGLATPDQLIEYEFNRDVTERLIELMSAAGLDYRRTLPRHGRYGNALGQRVRAANAVVSDLPLRGVSIHANAAPSNLGGGWQDVAAGPETWHYATSATGRAMAGVFQRRLRAAYLRHLPRVTHTVPRDRGLRTKTRGQFYILRATVAPFVLTEGPFMNHLTDVRLLGDPEFRQAWAEAHLDAILEIEGTYEPLAAYMAAPGPDDYRAALTFLSLLLNVFQRSPAERAARRRRRYVRSLQRREARGKITRAQYDRYLADYDRDHLPGG